MENTSLITSAIPQAVPDPAVRRCAPNGRHLHRRVSRLGADPPRLGDRPADRSRAPAKTVNGDLRLFFLNRALQYTEGGPRVEKTNND
jgi:hypothetical protein